VKVVPTLLVLTTENPLTVVCDRSSVEPAVTRLSFWPDAENDPMPAVSALLTSRARLSPAQSKTVSRRGNAELHAQALDLSPETWNNALPAWNRLEEVVTQLGAAAPKAAKDALASWHRSMRKLPNPFG
jgi:hypothetical protein